MSEYLIIADLEKEIGQKLEPIFSEYTAIFSGNQGDTQANTKKHIDEAFRKINCEVPEPIYRAIELLNFTPINAREAADAIYEWAGISTYLGTVYARLDRQLERIFWGVMPEKGTDKSKQAFTKAATADHAAVRDILKYLFLQSMRVRSELQSLLKLEREEYNMG